MSARQTEDLATLFGIDEKPPKRDSDLEVDDRNTLNDLSNREWLTLTKSVWYSRPGPRDDLKKKHPATFAEEDVEKFVRLFTKQGQLVLDPFLGTGSTILASLRVRRRCIGIELSEEWADIARQRCSRVQPELPIEGAGEYDGRGYEIICGDSRTELARFEDGSFDFILTSPPYWNILDKEGAKVMLERPELARNYGVDTEDLAKLSDYQVFRDNLKIVWKECFRVLKAGRYAVVIVTDFRHGPRYHLYHADIARDLEDCGFTLKGTIILVQDNKNLYAYGIPFSFVPNVHHQIALVVAKEVCPA